MSGQGLGLNDMFSLLLLFCVELVFGLLPRLNELPDRPFHKFRSFKIRRRTFLSLIKFADLMSLRLLNCEKSGRAERTDKNASNLVSVTKGNSHMYCEYELSEKG